MTSPKHSNRRTKGTILNPVKPRKVKKNWVDERRESQQRARKKK